MKRYCTMLLLSGAALMLVQVPASGAQQAKLSSGGEHREAASRLRFVDEDGDGLNDLVSDSDGDGIPNGDGGGKRSVSDQSLEALFHYGSNLPHQQELDPSTSSTDGGTSGAARSRGGGR